VYIYRPGGPSNIRAQKRKSIRKWRDKRAREIFTEENRARGWIVAPQTAGRAVAAARAKTSAVAASVRHSQRRRRAAAVRAIADI